MYKSSRNKNRNEEIKKKNSFYTDIGKLPVSNLSDFQYYIYNSSLITFVSSYYHPQNISKIRNSCRSRYCGSLPALDKKADQDEEPTDQT